MLGTPGSSQPSVIRNYDKEDSMYICVKHLHDLSPYDKMFHGGSLFITEFLIGLSFNQNGFTEVSFQECFLADTYCCTKNSLL